MSADSSRTERSSDAGLRHRSSAETSEQEIRRQRAMADTLDYFAEKPARVKKPRRKAVKSRARSYSWEESRYTGSAYPAAMELSNLGAFARAALEFYVSYREVPYPVLDEEGRIQLDNFSRPRAQPRRLWPEDDDGLETAHKIAKGAVWMTKYAIFQAWINITGGGYYRDIDADAFLPAISFGTEVDFVEAHKKAQEIEFNPFGEFADGQTRTRPKRNKVDSTSSDMDVVFKRLLRTGRLIRCPHTNGRYMFSEEMCKMAGLPEAWRVHVERGERWEGLFYTTNAVPLKEVMLDDAGREITHLELAVPKTTALSAKHPNQLLWDRVLYMLTPFVLFDKATVLYYSKEVGVAPDDKVNLNTVNSHIERWFETGKINRVFPGLYRSGRFFDWNERRDKREEIMIPLDLDWMVSFFFNQSRIQFLSPDRTFSVSDVYDWIMSHEQDQRKMHNWFGDREVRKGTITERLRDYLTKDYVARVGARTWQLTSYVMDACRPVWSDPGDLAPSREGTYGHRHIRLKAMPLDDAIKALTATEHNATIKMLLDRVMNESEIDHIAVGRKLQKIANRTGYKTVQNISAAYTAGYFDEGY